MSKGAKHGIAHKSNPVTQVKARPAREKGRHTSMPDIGALIAQATQGAQQGAEPDSAMPSPGMPAPSAPAGPGGPYGQ